MTPAEFPSFTRNSINSTLTKRHAGDNHFIAVQDGNITGAHALILRSYRTGKMPPTVLWCWSYDTRAQFFFILKCLLLSVRRTYIHGTDLSNCNMYGERKGNVKEALMTYFNFVWTG